MLHYTDSTAKTQERKSVRKEQRVKPSISDAIARAAMSVGMDESVFIVSAAYEKAIAIEKAQFSTSLDSEYFQQFSKAVNSQGKRIKGLVEAEQKSRDILRDA